MPDRKLTHESSTGTVGECSTEKSVGYRRVRVKTAAASGREGRSRGTVLRVYEEYAEYTRCGGSHAKSSGGRARALSFKFSAECRSRLRAKPCIGCGGCRATQDQRTVYGRSFGVRFAGARRASADQPRDGCSRHCGWKVGGRHWSGVRMVHGARGKACGRGRAGLCG